MTYLAIALKSLSFIKANSSTILAIASGIGMILSKNYSDGTSQVFQALMVLFGGTTVVSLQSALAKTQAQVQSAAQARS